MGQKYKYTNTKMHTAKCSTCCKNTKIQKCKNAKIQIHKYKNAHCEMLYVLQLQLLHKYKNTNTKIQKYKNAKMQKYKYTNTKMHTAKCSTCCSYSCCTNIKIQKYKNAKMQKYKYTNTKCTLRNALRAAAT